MKKRGSIKSAAFLLWENWKRFAKKIGEFQARVILGAFYFVIVCPFALVIRSVCDPLAIKPRAARGWQPRNQTMDQSIEAARRQS